MVIAPEIEERLVKIAVQVQPAKGASQEVEYRWDADTEILSAQLRPPPGGELATKGMSGSVGLEGSDGSWLILDVAAGRINGVEIAVWPDLKELPTLRVPANVEDAAVLVPARKSQADVASLESTTRLVAEADAAQRNFHFRVGKPRETRTIRLARDLLLDLDEKSQISGLWLLNVPPAPASLTE